MADNNPFLDAPIAPKAVAPDVVPGGEGQPARLTVRPQEAARPDNPFMAAPELPKTPTTTGAAIGRGITRGATFNFQDELEGLAAAGGLSPDDPNVLNAITALAKGGYKKIMGDPAAEQAFADQVAKSRALSAQMDAEHPVASTIGQVAGALSAPIGAGVRGATMGGRALAAGTVGAGVGGLSAAGDAEGNAVERLPETAKGVGIGAVAGAASVPALAAIEAGARRLMEPLGNIWRGYTAPADEAARRVVGAIRRDQGNADVGLTQAEFTGAQAGGQPVANMDIGGETTRAVARNAANVSPEARAVLNRTIDNRFETQGGRLADWLRYRFNFPDAAAQSQALEHAGRGVNGANYRRAFSDPAGHGLFDEGFEQLTVAPAVRDAIREAGATGANKAAVQGARPPQPPFVMNPDGSMRLRDPNQLPNLEFWDAVKRNLDDTINAATRAGRNSAANDARDLKRALVARLDEAVPSYRNARQGAAEFFGADNALEAGQAFVGSSGRLGAAASRDAIARMSPAERGLFQDGYVTRLIQKAENTNERRNILGQLATSQGARDELEIALGHARAGELEAWLRVEEVMDRARGAVQGNSTTTRQLLEAGLAGGAGYSFATGDLNPTHLLTAAFAGGLARRGGQAAVHRIDQGVARQVARLLTSNNPADLNRGLQIVANRPNMLAALRNADPAVARAGAEQAARVPILPAISGGRADENKKPAERPRP